MPGPQRSYAARPQGVAILPSCPRSTRASMSKTAPPLPRSAWMVGSSPTMTNLLTCSIAPPPRHRLLQRSSEHALGRGHGVRPDRTDRNLQGQATTPPPVYRLNHIVIVTTHK